MAIESEKKLEKKLREKIEALGGYCWKLPAIHIIGIPDRVCLLPMGIMFFVEVKTTKEKPRKIQLLWHKRLRKIGFEVYVVDTSKQIEDIVKKYTR